MPNLSKMVLRTTFWFNVALLGLISISDSKKIRVGKLSPILSMIILSDFMHKVSHDFMHKVIKYFESKKEIFYVYLLCLDQEQKIFDSTIEKSLSKTNT